MIALLGVSVSFLRTQGCTRNRTTNLPVPRPPQVLCTWGHIKEYPVMTTNLFTCENIRMPGLQTVPTQCVALTFWVSRALESPFAEIYIFFINRLFSSTVVLNCAFNMVFLTNLKEWISSGVFDGADAKCYNAQGGIETAGSAGENIFALRPTVG